MSRKKNLRKFQNSRPSCCFLVLLFVTVTIQAEVTVSDDTNTRISLSRHASRIISLAPHITELLFAAGAGANIIGAVRFSDYPDEASEIERVGDTYKLDIEKIVSLSPDLIIAWQSGNSPSDIALLRSLGFTVFISEPKNLHGIAETIEKTGLLTGNEITALKSSQHFLDRLSVLEKRFKNKKRVSVFYQFWSNPIFTVNGEHLISEIIQLCGGQNVYADLAVLSTQVSLESVLARDPEAIIASAMDAERPAWLDDWNKWKSIKAVQGQHLYHIPPDLIQRHAPRILDGAEMMCRYIDKARNNS